MELSGLQKVLSHPPSPSCLPTCVEPDISQMSLQTVAAVWPRSPFRTEASAEELHPVGPAVSENKRTLGDGAM